MTRLVADFSCALCGSATLLGSAYLIRARPRRSWFFVFALSWIVLSLWLLVVSFTARAPLAEARMRFVLAGLCLTLGPWFVTALSIGATSVRKVFYRWRFALALGGALSVGSAVLMFWDGIDWVTGIGTLPTTVIGRSGMLALGMALIPAMAAVVVFGQRMMSDIGTMPAVTVGTVGAVASIVWIAIVGLWRGYVTTDDLATAAALASVAALVWAAGVLRQLPVARRLAPSRGVVYVAVAVSVALSYAVAARVAYVAVAPIAAVLPAILPALLFLAVAGLMIAFGSQRVRYRVRGAIGRHLFRSKHDYGAVWVKLTRLVTEARDRNDLVGRVAVFCRDLLCVENVAVYLYDSAGTMRAAAVAGGSRGVTITPSRPDGESIGGLRDGQAAGVSTPDRTPIITADLLCPMRVNGHLLGFIAISGVPHAPAIDDEDRVIMDYVTAQVASALELHRLGEEIGDAREVGSFHRLSAFIIHDLKNLAAQQSFVLENAQKFGNDPEFVRDALAAFADSTARMRSLIARLRPGAPSSGTSGETAEVLGLVRELTAVSRLPGQCRVRITVPPDVASCHVRAETSVLTQVLTNLLVNAVESLPPDRGEIEVRVVRDLADWCIEVRDNGCGIPDAYMRNDLFHPFRSTKESGFGIGLYQCKVMIEAAGGRISVRSQEHQGTTVQLILPAADDVAAAASAHEGFTHGQNVAARR